MCVRVCESVCVESVEQFHYENGGSIIKGRQGERLYMEDLFFLRRGWHMVFREKRRERERE